MSCWARPQSKRTPCEEHCRQTNQSSDCGLNMLLGSWCVLFVLIGVAWPCPVSVRFESCRNAQLCHVLFCVLSDAFRCVVCSCFALYRIKLANSIASGSYVHVCPRPCLSTNRWTRPVTHRHRGPHSAKSVPSRPLWPCNHHMRVIAKETRLSP